MSDMPYFYFLAKLKSRLQFLAHDFSWLYLFNLWLYEFWGFVRWVWIRVEAVVY